jgi:DNA-binding IclR family transcriptional regulator
MTLDLDILRALLRLARRRSPPTLEKLLERVGGDEPAALRVLATLAELADQGLIQRTPSGFGLSLQGFAVAVACAEHSRPRRRTRKAERSEPLAPASSIAPATRRAA